MCSTQNSKFNEVPRLNFSQYKREAFMKCLNNKSNKTDTEMSYSSQLVILEQPMEKFRFRYKSEMHGTHGSLNGVRSEKTKKTFPEVELKNFNSSGVIRCSLYQTNIDKPSLHSHQLVVHKDDMDVCDPHDVYVSPEKGYIARFENMGIIHTAKKEMTMELWKKKKEQLKFDLRTEELSKKQEKALRDEAEREAKKMNLNQVCLCFEAFKIVDGGRWIRICEPVFSRPINNRKSALTGELKICRLSIAAGSAEGGDDLILLVEKVNKNNIKVRFFEIIDGNEVWEAFGYFTEAHVHHQFAIVVRTPAYKNKDIDNHVNVFIELVRESDNDRSSPVTFRYKPRDIVLSRKRRRTMNSSSSSSPASSYELSESVLATGMIDQIKILKDEPQEISELSDITDPTGYICEFNTFMQQVVSNSDELFSIFEPEFEFGSAFLEMDGEASLPALKKRHGINAGQYLKTRTYHPTMKLLMNAFNNCDKLDPELVIQKVNSIYGDFAAANDNGDTIVHEIIKQGNKSDAIIVFKILSKLNLTHWLSQTNNLQQTPLHVACIFDRSLFIRPLLGLKCDANVQDIRGNTALHIAIAENLKECTDTFASFMSSCNLNANLTNDDGLTPLNLAVRKNNAAFVKILLEKCNAFTNANSVDGNNSLHLAVQQQSQEIVKIILENGNVNINATNRAGQTAVDLAQALKGSVRMEILNLLQHYPVPSNEMVTQTTKFIKEEPEDSNSSTGDEDDKSSLSSIEIKQENDINVRKLLKNESICRQLADMLNVDEKWKRLGMLLKVDHLLFMWADAEAMLKCVVRNDKIYGCNLLNAIEEVDNEAARMIESLL